MKMTDVWGLAGGGIILGGVQAGFELTDRKSHGFGDDSVEANRAILGNFNVETAEAWEPVQEVSYVAGVPPCSGFSLLNTSEARSKKFGKQISANARGMQSAINACQQELVSFAAHCRGGDGERGAEFVVFESVQGAFTTGSDLMRTYRDVLVAESGQDYHLTHLLHSGATLGNAQMRARYFWVAHRVPFGVEVPDVKHVHTYRDAIGDLAGYDPVEWDDPIILDTPAKTNYQDRLREKLGAAVYGHTLATNEKQQRILQELAQYWVPGEDFPDVYRRYIRRFGGLPEGADNWWNFEDDKPRGFWGPRRVRWDYPGYVITGGGGGDFIHPDENRTLTVRELARLMGVPDAWDVNYVRPGVASQHLGKNCPTHSGRWIAEWIKRALEGNPGDVSSFGKRENEKREDWETVVDFTNLWRPVWKRQQEALDAA